MIGTALLLLAVQDPALEAARTHWSGRGADVVGELAELLRLPCVASNLEDVRANARWIAERCAQRGFETKVLELEGAAPAVHGVLEVPGATRTLGLYVHYDGQPVSEDLWTHSPWEPTLLTAALEDGGVPRPLPERGEAIDPEWRLYARAAGDDKAPIPALLAAVDALETAELAITSNLVLFFEGEEEAGSPNLRRYLEAYRDELQADVWLFLDGPVHPSRRPQLVFGVRGVTGFELTVYGAVRGLHSGHYGNWAPNPAQMLAELLATLKDDAGNVLVPGFFDTTAEPSAAERAALAALPPIDAELKRELGLGWTEGGGAPLAERLLLPSLNVRGIRAADVGDKARNVIPARATAALDIRLVPGNDPSDMIDRVERHVREQGYRVVTDEPDLETRLTHRRVVRLTRGGGYRAARTPLDHPAARPVVEAARRVAGGELLLVPSLGGSLPLYLIEEVLGRPFVIVPIANHDDNQHAPDENLRLANLAYGVELFACLLTAR